MAAARSYSDGCGGQLLHHLPARLAGRTGHQNIHRQSPFPFRFLSVHVRLREKRRDREWLNRLSPCPNVSLWWTINVYVMDVMADILAAMRVGRPVAAYTEAYAPWGLRFHHITGAAFHVVLQGTC